MSQISTIGNTELQAPVEVQKAAMEIVSAKALAAYARKQENWEAVERAELLIMEDQRLIAVEYNNTFKHGGDRKSEQVRSAAVLKACDWCKRLGVSDDTVQRWAKRFIDDAKFSAECEKVHLKIQRIIEGQSSAHVQHNAGEHEWYTPECFIESARLVMGKIDLDPATSKKAQETVKAIRYFTAEDNGLHVDNEWFGNIWMNPPYQAGLIDRFIAKLHMADDVTSAIVLVNNSTDTAWFSLLMEKAAAVCFPKGRVKFLDQDGKPGAPLQGQAIVYRGGNSKEFVNEFSQYGFCLSKEG